MAKRVSRMTESEYAYHFLWEGDDPTPSCNVIRLLILAVVWLRGTASPRETDELVANLHHIRQCLNGWK